MFESYIHLLCCNLYVILLNYRNKTKLCWKLIFRWILWIEKIAKSMTVCKINVLNDLRKINNLNENFHQMHQKLSAFIKIKSQYLHFIRNARLKSIRSFEWYFPITARPNHLWCRNIRTIFSVLYQFTHL